MIPINFSTTIGLFKKYRLKYSSHLNIQQEELADEMLNKLQDLDELSLAVTNMINNLVPVQNLSPDKNDVITFGPFKIQLQRADSNVPIQLDNATIAYKRGDSSKFSIGNQRQVERVLERNSTHCYQIANRIVHITKKLPRLDAFESPEIWIIRNYLIEHPEGENSGITYDSFPYSKNEGPFIKGLRKGNQMKHMDRGFKKNFREFTSSLNEILKLSTNGSEEVKHKDFDK